MRQGARVPCVLVLTVVASLCHGDLVGIGGRSRLGANPEELVDHISMTMLEGNVQGH